MANSTNTILNKSLIELRKKSAFLFNEIEEIGITIKSIENLLSVGAQSEATKNRHPKKKRKSRQKSKISETTIRDSIIDIYKNPRVEDRHFPLNTGFFTTTTIKENLNLSDGAPVVRIKEVLENFENKGILESKKYKTGKQYRYIPPATTGPGKEFEQSKAITSPTNISMSNPIPGTGKNGLTLRNKDIEKLVNKAVSEGFTAERLGSDHLRISKSGMIATISTTGTDKARYVENCRSDLKRIGVQV